MNRRHKGRKSCADAREWNSHLDSETFWRLHDAYWDGKSIRQAARECGIAKETVHAMYKRQAEVESEVLENMIGEHSDETPPAVQVDGKWRIACGCGRWRGHKGWCSQRMEKSPARQALMARLHARQRERGL